ncbi:MAG: hypothetical protein V7L25_21220 [Nostoc sp.]
MSHGIYQYIRHPLYYVCLVVVYCTSTTAP